MRRTRRVLFCLSLCAAGATSAWSRPANDDWPQFRGARARGINDSHPLPVTWDVKATENVLWKTAIPGLAHASPIVTGKRIFIATAVPKGIQPELKVGLYGAGDSAKDMVEHAFQLICVHRDTGQIEWTKTAVAKKPAFARHTKATHANSTPATDGERVVALFGSEGLYCYSLEGELEWKVSMGELDVGPHNSLDLEWGYASSPIIVDSMVIVQADVKKNSFLAAYDVRSGQPLWRVERADVPGWCTPTAYRGEDGLQIITNGCKQIGAYRAKDGSQLWRMAGGGGIPVPAPVIAGDLIYLTSNHRPLNASHPQKPIFVVKANARGDLGVPRTNEPGEHLAWMQTRHGSYMQTPLVYRGVAYFGKTNGVVGAFDAKTGELLYRERLGEGGVGFSASAVAGDGKVYFTSEEGDIYVLAAKRKFELLAHNDLEQICMATPAISNGTLIVRTQRTLMAFGSR